MKKINEETENKVKNQTLTIAKDLLNFRESYRELPSSDCY